MLLLLMMIMMTMTLTTLMEVLKLDRQSVPLCASV